ncbi:MAG: S8 family serine peptidase [Rhizobiaceae bacterium]
MRLLAIALALLVVCAGTPAAFAQTTGNGNNTGGGPTSPGDDYEQDLWGIRTGCAKGRGASTGKRNCNRQIVEDTETDIAKPQRVKRAADPAQVVIVPADKPKLAPKKKPAARTVKKPVSTALAAIPRARPAVEPDPLDNVAYVPDEVLVTLEGGAGEADGIAAQFGLEVRSQRASLLLGARFVRFGIPDGRSAETVLATLQAAGIASAELNHVYALQAVKAAPSYAFARIALAAPKANGKGVRIAVIDSAADRRHPALKGVFAGFFDSLPDRKVVDASHGTSIDGLIAGSGNVTGMAPKAKILHARAFENGKSTMSAILDAFDWAVGQDARIVNMSFAGPRNRMMEKACASAFARGVILIAAAGNNGPGAPDAYPGAYSSVVAVTATNETDGLMPQANRGAYVYAAAPGVDVLAPVPGGGVDFVTGTSFAAAIATGAVANLIASDRTRDAAWVMRALADTARDLGPAGRDGDFGFGLIDVSAAASVVLN